MNDFISAYPGVIYILGCGLIWIIVHQYRVSKRLEKSALLTEVGKAVTAIEGMAEQITCLFKKDGHKEGRIDQLEVRMGNQETKCAEREKLCPGLRGLHAREGETLARVHARHPKEE